MLIYYMLKCNDPVCDLQSAGMVCFYIISRGSHPYATDGDWSMTQLNVRTGEFDLSDIDDPMACDLVKQMLAHEQSSRPPAKELLR